MAAAIVLLSGLLDVPSNSMCSKKCAMPLMPAFSSFEPVFTMASMTMDLECVGSCSNVMPFLRMRLFMSRQSQKVLLRFPNGTRPLRGAKTM